MPSQRTRGFTLIELMVTVAIIGISMAMAIPSIAQAMRDRRVQQTAVDFMAPFREARSRAMMRGAAHLVSVQLGGNSSETVYEAENGNSSCQLSQFPRIATQLISTNATLVDTGNVQVVNTNPGQNVIEYCYSPSGRMMFRFDSASAFLEDNGASGGTVVNGGFLYEISNPSFPGTTVRRVFIPLGGIPRLAQ